MPLVSLLWKISFHILALFLTTLIISNGFQNLYYVPSPVHDPGQSIWQNWIGAKAYRSHFIGKESRKDKHVYKLTLLYNACQCNELRKRNGRNKENWNRRRSFIIGRCYQCISEKSKRICYKTIEEKVNWVKRKEIKCKYPEVNNIATHQQQSGDKMKES